MPDETRSVMTERSAAMARKFMATTHPIGKSVHVVGGFGAGETGRVIGVRQRAQGPYSSDYPVFYILTDDGRILGGWDVGSLAPDTQEPADMGYVLECYSCGAWGTLHLFGMGNGRQCPNCGSSEVHNHES